MEGWSVERIQQLAPDAASAKAGQGLAGARHWVSSGVDDTALWGECKGSGAKPYQVRVDLSEPAFKCSCPSRKFPCKHALGLMHLFAGGTVAPSARPAWIEEWFTSRTARAEKKQEKAESPKPVDAAAQQKRKESRLTRVGEGMAAVKLWLHDLVRTGLASVPSRGYSFFDDQARRLIDAQAPGVARRVQSLAEVASSGAGWQHAFLERSASIYLLIRAYEQRSDLPEATRDLLLNVIGIPRPQEEVLATPATADRWQVIAQDVTQEDPLRVQQTWLLGERTGQRALVLAFAHGAQPLDATLAPGFAFEGEVCRYPGDPLRALVKSRGDLKPLNTIAGALGLDALVDQYANERAANPWLDGFAAAVTCVVPTRTADGWSLVGVGGGALPLLIAEDAAWTLLAVSGGRPIDVVVFFDGKKAAPLAALVNGEFLRLQSQPDEVAA